MLRTLTTNKLNEAKKSLEHALNEPNGVSPSRINETAVNYYNSSFTVNVSEVKVLENETMKQDYEEALKLDYFYELYHERAAIYQYDAGLKKGVAEWRAANYIVLYYMSEHGLDTYEQVQHFIKVFLSVACLRNDGLV